VSPESTIKKDGMSRRDLLKVAGATTAATAFGLPFRDIANLGRILGYFSGEPVNCFNKVESENSVYPYDVIAICGGGIGYNSHGEPEPSAVEQLRLRAGAIAFIKNMAPQIILLDGVLPPDVGPNMDTKHLQGYVSKISQNEKSLPDNAVIVDRVSVNTASNMEQLRNLAEKYGFGKILLITSDFHLDGAELYACANDINAFPQAAEKLILEYNPSRKKEITDVYQNQPMVEMNIKEKLRIISAIYDPKGELSILIKKIDIH
jgi:hypothetical protein